MGIVAEDIARVRESTDLVGLVSQHLALKRVGSSWMGLCPFHGENSPSFSVSPEKGFFHCFGCGKSGDAITFAMEIDHLDFVGAVESLAAKANITLRYDDNHQGETRRERTKLVETMAEAVDWYHEQLLTSTGAGAARSYLRARGINGDDVRQFKLGWAPDAWDALAKAMPGRAKTLGQVGLTFVNRRGRVQDFFRARLLFPIFDAQGDPVSFGGRVMPDGQGPKYRNTAETALYHKSRVLYGLNWAKADVVRADQVIVCEGYTDVIGFAKAGVGRAVATCGTALTEDHVVQLRKFARRIVLAFDPDAAGKAAADRVYAWESSHDLDISVVELGAGEDPADVARRDPAALAQAVEAAKPFLGYRVERVLASGDFTSPEGRARVAQRAIEVIAEHPNALVRDPYLMEVADHCRVEPDRLRTLLASLVQGGARGSVANRSVRNEPTPPQRSSNEYASGEPDYGEADPFDEDSTAPNTPAAAVETEALRAAVHHPTEMLDRITGALFSDQVHRVAFEALVASRGDVHAAVDQLDPAAAALVARMAVATSDADPIEVAQLLVKRAGDKALKDLERSARMAADPLEFAPLMSWLKLQLESLDADDATQPGAGAELVTWITQRDVERA